MASARAASHRANEALVATVQEVLIEGTGTLNDQPVLVGRSRRDAPEVDGVVFVTGDAAIGEIVSVRISGALDYDLSGDLVPTLAVMTP